jgi:hypothetical protein
MAEKVRSWIPWTIAALAVGITLYTNAVSYGGTKQTVQNTAFTLKEHCNDQKIKEKETDTVLQDVRTELAVVKSQNGMILESLTALRKYIDEKEK